MSMMTKLSPKQLQAYNQRCTELIQGQQTLFLSTVSENATPEISYAPFVRGQTGDFLVYVSELAMHTQNMLQTGRASILFIQPEQQAKNLFARERIVLECKVMEISPTEACYTDHIQIMHDKFGEIMDLLASLSDFHLLTLKPVNGKYIAGFGQAFSICTAKTELQIEG